MASDTTNTVKSNARSTERKAAATKRSTSAKKAAETRANKATTANAKRTTTKAKRTTKSTARSAKSTARTAEARTEAAASTATQEAKTGFDFVGDVAERAVLTGVGVVLSARDEVRELRDTYSSRAKVERQLRKAQRDLETDLRRFERRGTSARNSLEREVKRTRTKVERELRQRRQSLTKVVGVDVDVAVPSPDALARNAKAQADLAQVRVGNAVETAQLAGAQVVARVSERVAALV